MHLQGYDLHTYMWKVTFIMQFKEQQFLSHCQLLHILILVTIQGDTVL